MQNLQLLRKSRKLKQSDVADAIGVPVSTYGCWENDISQPNMEAMKKLANFFDVSVDIIIDRTNYSLQQLNDDIEKQKEKWLSTLTPLQQSLIESILKLNVLQQNKVQAYMYGLLN